MLNDSIPPVGPGAPPPPEEPASQPSGGFHFKEGRTFLGMEFSAKEWADFMNILNQNFTQHMNKVMNKLRESMKKSWKRGAGEDVD